MGGAQTGKNGAARAASTPADVLAHSFQTLLRLLFVGWLLAWLLTKTSSYLLFNLPIALALVFAGKWLAAYIDEREALTASGGGSGRPRQLATIDWRSPSFIPHVRLNDADRDAWRAAVNAKRVELAWEQFCNSVLQEWVYDAWYAYMTPDREFPAEVRKLLNNVFGELCIRARRMDLRAVLVRDMSEILIENLQLYRQTVDAIGADNLANMTPAKREEALQRELNSEDKLHPALQTPDGHYQVLRNLSDGVVQLVLPPQERELALPRAIVRELLAACVLRPVMMYFTPYSINQIFMSVLPSDSQPAARPAGSARQHFEGSQGFNERARQSAVLESVFLEQQATQNLGSGSLHAFSSAATADQEFAPVPLAVAAGLQAYRRPAHLRSRSWDDTLLPASHALQSTYDSLILSTMDSRDDGFRSDGEQQSSRHPTHPRQVGGRSSDAVKTCPIPAPFIPDPSVRPPTPPPAPGPTPTPHPAIPPSPPLISASPQRTSASAAASLQTTPTGSPTRAATPLTAAPSSAPVSPTQAPPLAPPPASSSAASRPAFDEVQEATAASLLQQHPNLQEQLATAGGQLQAAVLAAYTLNDGAKDFVLYQIQVCEGDSMWTVSRRYRNFELLHRRLRELPGIGQVYRALGLAPPPKRIMANGNDRGFMLKRAQDLQAYLDAVLADPRLARCDEVRKFFSSVNDMYSPDDGGSLLKSLTSNVDLATNRVKRAVGGVLDEGRERITTLSSSMRDSTRRMGGLAPRIRAAASSASSKGLPPVPPLRSFASAILSSDPSSSSATSAASSAYAPPPLPPATCSAPHPTTPPPPPAPSVFLEATSGSAAAAPTTAQPPPPAPADSPPPLLTKAPAATLTGSTGTGSAPPSLDWSGSSRRATLTLFADTDAGGSGRRGGRQSDAGVVGGGEELAEGAALPKPLHSIVVAVFELQGRGFFRRQVVALATQMLSLVAGGAIDSFVAEQLRTLSSEPTIARWITSLQAALWPGGIWYSTAAAAAAAGGPATPTASAPGTPTAAGSPTKCGAAASPKASPKKSLLGPSKAAAAKQALKGLPPGLVADAVAAAAAGAGAAAGASLAAEAAAGGSGGAAKGGYMTAENFMHQAAAADEAEVAEAVRARLLAAAPAALVRLVGQKCYSKSMTEVFEMLQSPTFTYQIGYRALETLAMALCPELRES